MARDRRQCRQLDRNNIEWHGFTSVYRERAYADNANKMARLGSRLGTSVAGASLLGCDQSCDVDATCVPEGWPSMSGNDDGCPADPADGPVRPDCGVWVSATLGQDTYSGTQRSPVQTLKEAITRAQAGAKRVYACGEIYDEPVSLPSGVSLFGGFDCQNNWIIVAWRSGQQLRRSQVRSP